MWLCKLSSTDSGFSYSTSVLVLFWFGIYLEKHATTVSWTNGLSCVWGYRTEWALSEGMQWQISAVSGAVISIPIKTLEH